MRGFSATFMLAVDLVLSRERGELLKRVAAINAIWLALEFVRLTIPECSKTVTAETRWGALAAPSGSDRIHPTPKLRTSFILA